MDESCLVRGPIIVCVQWSLSSRKRKDYTDSLHNPPHLYPYLFPCNTGTFLKAKQSVLNSNGIIPLFNLYGGFPLVYNLVTQGSHSMA